MNISIEIQPIVNAKTGIGWYTQKILENLTCDDIVLQGNVFNFLNKNDISESIGNLDFQVKTNKFMPYSIYRRIWDYIPIPYNYMFKSTPRISHFFNYIVPPKVEGRIITTVYDMVYRIYPETMTKKNYNRLNKELKRSVDLSDKVITISENSKREIMKFLDVDEHKIEIIPPGVDREEYAREYKDEEVTAVMNKYKIPSEYILYLGTLEPRKNIDNIIDAYANLKVSMPLVIAGKKGWMYNEIFDKVKKHKLEDKIIFTGYVHEEDKPLIYKMSKVFVFPSMYEGFGMPVLEAMTAGVPVITSNTSALPEVVGDAGILINPRSVGELSEAIKKVLENTSLREEMIRKGLKQSEMFSWKRSAMKLLEIYKEVGEYEKDSNKWAYNK